MVDDNEVVRQEAPKFTFWVCVAFTLNYIVGSGFLTLPWAFEQTGPIIGVLVLSLFAFYAVLSVIFILETCDRASTFVWKNQTKRKVDRNGYQTIVSEENNDSNILIDGQQFDIINSAAEEGSRKAIGTFNIITSIRKDVDIENTSASTATGDEHKRKFEITELCELFLGSMGRQFYSGFLAIYMYGTLWAYSTVFAKSFASHLPMTFLFGSHNLAVAQDLSYYLYLSIFGLLVVPMSLMEFSEQISVQVALTVFRVVMLFVMVTSIGVAYWSGGAQFSDIPVSSSHSADGKIAVHLDKLYLLLPIVAYAFIFHHSVPSLAHPVQNKRSLVKIFTLALLISFAAYAVLGTVVSLFFGADLNTASNLNWETYVGVRNRDGSVPIYAQIVTFFVVLFPALDVASAFPLNAYTLGNNMMSAYYGRDMHLHETSRLKLSFFRVCAAVPPLFGAMLVHDLDKITKFTGLSGFAVMFIFPALLSRASSLKLLAIGADPVTIHSGPLTSPVFQWLVGGSGMALLIIVSVFLVVY